MIPLNPRVASVNALENHQLALTFKNGEHGVFDCKEYLNFGIFKELVDVKYFQTVKADHGTICWPNGQDFCPDTLYLGAVKQTDIATNKD
jgi:hypothetical protein